MGTCSDSVLRTQQYSKARLGTKMKTKILQVHKIRLPFIGYIYMLTSIPLLSQIWQYSEFDRAHANSIFSFGYSEKALFQMKHSSQKTSGICQYYLALRSILWTCIQHIQNMYLSWGLNHGLWHTALLPVYGQFCALSWMCCTQLANSLKSCLVKMHDRKFLIVRRSTPVFKYYERLR